MTTLAEGDVTVIDGASAVRVTPASLTILAKHAA